MSTELDILLQGLMGVVTDTTVAYQRVGSPSALQARAESRVCPGAMPESPLGTPSGFREGSTAMGASNDAS